MSYIYIPTDVQNETLFQLTSNSYL